MEYKDGDCHHELPVRQTEIPKHSLPDDRKTEIYINDELNGPSGTTYIRY